MVSAMSHPPSPFLSLHTFSVLTQLMVGVGVRVMVRGRVAVRAVVALQCFNAIYSAKHKPVRGSEHPRGMPLVTRTQELQACDPIASQVRNSVQKKRTAQQSQPDDPNLTQQNPW
jgi:hypothetical protein